MLHVVGRPERFRGVRNQPIMSHQTTPETLLPQSAVRTRLGGIGRTTLWSWVRAGDFPAPIRVGAKRIMWRESELQRWIDNRQSAVAQ